MGAFAMQAPATTPAPTHADVVAGNTPGQPQALKAAGALLLAKTLVEEPVESERQQRIGAVHDESAKLTTQLGIRPRNYRPAVDAPRNDAQVRFANALPAVTQRMNAALASSGSKLRLSEAELATNFMSEGGVILLELDKVDDIDGYYYAGVDSLVDRYKELERFLPDDVRALCKDPKHHATNVNEQQTKVTSVKDLDLEQTLYANAAMYADAAVTVEHDLKAQGVELATLPAQARVFWTTVYFNCGELTAKKLFAQHGVDWYKKVWTQDDTPAKHLSDAKYNATMRVANFDLMNADLDGPKKGAHDLVGLPTAPVASEAVSVDTVLQKQDAIFDAWKAVLDGKSSVMSEPTLDEMLALTDIAVRAEGVPPQLAKLIHDRRAMAYEMVNARYLLKLAFDGKPELPTMTFSQVGMLYLHYGADRYLHDQIYSYLDAARKLDSPALHRLAGQLKTS